ncbi:5'-3' exonuclease [Buchnera aphidicola]|uniref:5'-3' exonuclease n=1 Tax=Buchnera aphidicola TaxID=9 RepID=UPI0031B89C37
MKISYFRKSVILIDGHCYAYRIYYGQIKNNKKINLKEKFIKNILYVVKKIILKYQPKKIIIIFDNKKKSFRDKIFKKYKKNRNPIPKILKKYIKDLQSILVNIGIPIFCIPYVEADDVIGTLSKIIEKNGDVVLIVTSDKDLTQLINKNIYILNIIDKKIINFHQVKKKYGVYPNLIVDLLSLVGDPSDNIPGVKGIGKKTAVQLLNNIGCIKKIYKNYHKIYMLNFRNKKNIVKRLLEGEKMANLSYKLAKIKLNVICSKEYKKNNLYELYKPCKYNNIKYINIIYEIKKNIINSIL